MACHESGGGDEATSLRSSLEELANARRCVEQGLEGLLRAQAAVESAVAGLPVDANGLASLSGPVRHDSARSGLGRSQEAQDEHPDEDEHPGAKANVQDQADDGQGNGSGIGSPPPEVELRVGRPKVNALEREKESAGLRKPHGRRAQARRGSSGQTIDALVSHAGIGGALTLQDVQGDAKRLQTASSGLAPPDSPTSAANVGVASLSSMRSAPGIESMMSGTSTGRKRRRALPQNWPSSIVRRQEIEDWLAFSDLAGYGGDHRNIEEIHTMLSRRTSPHTLDRSHSNLIGKQAKPRWVIIPHSRLRIFLDIVSLCVLSFDLVVIPIVLAFDIDINGWLLALVLLTVCFWTLDIIFNFMTGIYLHGTLQLDHQVIARNYIRTWFFLDLAVVTADWTGIALRLAVNHGANSFKLLRLVKVGRLLRVFGLLHMRRFTESVERVTDRTLPAGGEMVSKIIKMFSLIIWTNHLMSCMWYAIGRYEALADTGLHWLDAPVGFVEHYSSYSDQPKVYAYVTAFHWSLTQMTPGSMQVNPLNSTERVFTILCLLLGMVFFSSLLSSVSAKLTEFRISQEKNTRIVSTVRKYLRQKGVTVMMATDVQKQLADRMAEQPPLVAKDVMGLTYLSQSLRMRLSFEVVSPVLAVHPLFRWWATIDPKGLAAFCYNGVESRVVSAGDTLFNAGTLATSAYVLVSGAMKYVLLLLEDDHDESGRKVPPGSWIAEAALWAEWMHVGNAESLTPCEILQINVSQLGACVRHSRMVGEVFADYGRAYHATLVAQGATDELRSTQISTDETLWPDDMKVPMTDFHELLHALSLYSRQCIGLAAVEVVRQHFFLVSQVALDKLGDEVRSGKCMLCCDPSGDVERHVSVVALRLMSTDGMLLAKIGSWEDGKVERQCVLPGLKQLPGEPSFAAVQRHLDREMAPLKHIISFEDVQVEYSKATSLRTRVRTRYKRTVHEATLTHDYKDIGLCFIGSGYDDQGFSRRSSAGNAPDIFILADDGGGVYFYAWVTPNQFDYLRKNDRVVQTWLDNLVYSSGEIETARALYSMAQENVVGEQGSVCCKRI